MDANALQRKIDRAFRTVPRPATFTICRCDECSVFDALLRTRDHQTITEADIGMSLCLMSPEGLVYWTPSLVRLCLTRDRDNGWEACNHFIDSELGLPLSRRELPCQHPKFTSLNSEQTILLLDFLKLVQELWYTQAHEETPRELARAIRNWSNFAGVNLDTDEQSRNNPMDRSGGSTAS